MARNWDDFLQRDLMATTFPRAFGIFVCNTMFFIACTSIARRLLPVGRFGIRKVTETSLYHNFGPLGVLGAAGIFATGTPSIIQESTPSTRPSNSHCGNSTATC